jgi:hypothetical protein
MWITLGLAAPLIALGSAKPVAKQAAAAQVLPAPQAAFDYNPLTSLKANPTITGSASSLVGPLYFKVLTEDGDAAYEDSSVLVSGGRFAETIYPPIANGTYKLSVGVGTKELASTTLTVGLHTLIKVEPDLSLSAFDVADGHLMRFKITAQGTDGAGIGQLGFSVVPNNADVTDIQLYGYTDEAFSNSITEDGSALSTTSVSIDADTSFVTVVPDTPIEIPGGQTYYFDLVGTVAPTDSTYDVDTKLLGDTNAFMSVFASVASTSDFVWSPNTHGVSALADLDWINGSIVAGIPKAGLETVRTNPPPTDAPTCEIESSTSTAAAGTPVTLTWVSNGAQSARLDTNIKADVSGTKVYALGSTTHTYILNVTNPYGFGTCFATVVVPGTSYAATSSPATTTPAVVDSFTAKPVTGSIPLSVTFAGSVNNSKSCSAQTFTFGYGDGTASSTISVPVNSCKAVAFSFVHSYTKVATSTAGLYRSTGTTTAQRIQTQVIVAKAKVAFDAPSVLLANVLSAVGSGFNTWVHLWLNFFGL